MNFELSDDQRMLAETLGRFLSDKYPLEKRHENTASEEGYSRELWSELAELGVIGALFSEDVGGFGGTGDDICVVFEQLGRALVVEPFLPTLLAGSVLASVGDQQTLLEDVISGQTMITLAHGEPASRYVLEHVETSAAQKGDGWKIAGQKSVAPGAGSADKLVVSARTSGNHSDQDGISLFLVDSSAEGLRLRDYGTVDGYPAADVVLDNVDAILIGEQEKGFAHLDVAVSKAIVACCAEGLGAMEVAKDLTVEYMHTRKQFGVPIGKFQVLQHRMADVLIELEQMRSSIINAASRLGEAPAIRSRHVSAAKFMLGNIGRQVAEEAIQIHGGMGMTWEYPVGHYAKRIIMLDHLLGDTDHHLVRYMSAAA